MALDAHSVRIALARAGDGTASAVAEALGNVVAASRTGSAIVELFVAGPWVQFVVAGAEPRHWEIECVSADEFRIYPGIERDGYVAWANIWVRSNLSVQELVDQLNDAAFRKVEDA